MKEKIAVVDDEEDILSLVQHILEKNGFSTVGFENGKSLYMYLEKNKVDLIILDLMLPDIDGLEICKYVRNHESYQHIPVIMLTAKDQELDKVLGLELGADDYITKPFSPRELVARVKSVLRRSGRTQPVRKVIHIGEHVEIDEETVTVTVKGEKIPLTATEFKILVLLAKKPGKVYTREDMLEYLWGNDKYVIDRTIDVHIRHIRKKLGQYGSIIKSIKGMGYKLEIS
jgi:two-component system phosphate regulon response regulator PhoB/two-component system alkaline phosphatase synthesis response regulator PhoP